MDYIEIHGRAKRLYSLYQKLSRYDNDINKIYDLIALRILVPTIADCYAVLGLIHNTWTPLKGRIKDYISQPKPNGYQSLHTTVFSEEGDILEVQIRTPEMHREAEYGVAAHLQYKNTKSIPAKKIKWMKELARVQKQFKGTKEYFDNLQKIKLDFLQNRIFVFTPHGDVLELPEHATPVDFAYLIHSDIGNKCSGALINGKMCSLDSPLKNGDVVEILIDKKRDGPNSDWIKFVKTDIARSRIKTHFNKNETRLAGKHSMWPKRSGKRWSRLFCSVCSRFDIRCFQILGRKLNENLTAHRPLNRDFVPSAPRNTSFSAIWIRNLILTRFCH